MLQANRNTILVVEDEPFILNNICTILEISGYNYLKATNGIEALDLLQQHIPQLILCDVMMPTMNGFELLQHLLSSENLSTIPFCFLSARADVIDIENGLTLGAKAYVTKPFLAKELLQTIDQILEN